MGLLVLVAMAIGVVAAPAAAQISPGELEIVEVDTRRFPQTVVTVTLPREIAGRDVPSEAFTVTVGGREHPAEATLLPSDALDVVLVFDTSGSMAGAPMTEAKAAAIGFVESMPPGTRMALVGFSSTPSVVAPFTTDPVTLTEAIDGLPASGETALYDAVVDTVGQLQVAGRDRTSVILLSDGGDTTSEAPLEAATAALTGIETDLYIVSLTTPETDLEALNALTAAGEGRLVAADEPGELAGVYDAIASKIVHRYELAFQSTVGGSTEISVSVDHDGVTGAAQLAAELPALDAAARAGPTGAVATEPATPRVVSSPSLFESRFGLIVGASTFGIALVVAAWFLLAAGAERAPLMRARRRLREHRPKGGWLSEASERVSALAERAVEQRGQTSALNDALDRAGLVMRPGEFVVVVASGAFLAFAVGSALFNALVGIVLAGGSPFVARSWLRWRAERRRAAFADQLGDTLQILAGSLRTGYGLLQAADAVARESQSPTADEFRRLLVEVRLGRDLNQALSAMADRMGSEDFHWVVQAIRIHREVGGDLAEVLDRVGATIRDRNRLRRQVKALSAEGRLSALILFVLPFAFAGLIAILNPEYLAELTGRTVGQVMIAFGLTLVLAGGLWMRRLIRVEF